MNKKHKRVKMACYATSISMSIILNLSPILFLTFRNQYGISFSLLGLLVLVNFLSQMTVDLVFSFFSHRFNIPLAVKITPVLSLVGLVIFAVWPWVFPEHVFPGLVLGTIIFSASGGFSEGLLSPVIAALPSKDPDREMSAFHAVYAWGTVALTIFATLFLLIFGAKSWQWMALLLVSVPLTATILFSKAEIPPMETPEKVSGVLRLMKNKGLWLCGGAIFLGGICECTMAQWSSGYLEQAIGIPKVWGDIFGVALFSIFLGLGRSLYGKIGKNISAVLLWGAIGCSVCYITAAISSIPLLGLMVCAFTGFCASMLWPGSLVVSTDQFPAGGVFIYAMMAAGGDFGASIGPQLVGIITDLSLESPSFLTWAQTIGLAPEQASMKLAMRVVSIFPLLAIPLYAVIHKKYRKQKAEASVAK